MRQLEQRSYYLMVLTRETLSYVCIGVQQSNLCNPMKIHCQLKLLISLSLYDYLYQHS